MVNLIVVTLLLTPSLHCC